MTEPNKRSCLWCGKPFIQPRVQGRPWNYCGYTCHKLAHNERTARAKRERYTAMRAAGVPASNAIPACHSKRRYELEMRKVGALCSD